jgi:hypothetical protein
LIHTRRGLLLVAALTFVIALIILFPARIAYQWAAPAGFAASGIHGTVWSGQADAVSADGIYLRDVSWRMHPMYLFTGKLAYRLKGLPVSGFIDGNVRIGIGPTVTVSDLTASLPLQLLAVSLRIRGLQGTGSLQIQKAALRRDRLIAADGVLQVADFVAPRISSQPIGGYRAEFFTEDDGIVASIEDADGAVDLAGKLELKNDFSYSFLGLVQETPRTPADLRRKLQDVPLINDRGQRELRAEGVMQLFPTRP